MSGPLNCLFPHQWAGRAIPARFWLLVLSVVAARTASAATMARTRGGTRIFRVSCPTAGRFASKALRPVHNNRLYTLFRG